MGKKLHFKRNRLYLEDLTLEDLTQCPHPFRIEKYSVFYRGPLFTARAESLMLHAGGNPLHQEVQTSVGLHALKYMQFKTVS